MKPLFLLLCCFSFEVLANGIRPFTTDGCSLFPDGDGENNIKWVECCIRHDYAYWKGGAEKEREAADSELRQCVAELGEKEMSLIMHVGVRLGGEPYFPTWYRWGYGWPYLRGYQALTQSEQSQVKKQTKALIKLLDELYQSEK